MNPIQLSDSLKHTLRSYLTTIFDVNRDGQEAALATAIESSFNVEGALSNGPFLEITPPYATGLSLRQLTHEGVLTSKLIDLPDDNLPLGIDIPLYAHQEKAIRRLISDRRNIVVSSGTGSGKTESFLIPILNDLLQDPTPGVRALLIYPLNALVNDQLDRLRTLLKGTDITFGRYTSELDQTLDWAERKYPHALPNEVIARDQIRSGEKIPQILITNYAMLEYLLLRPEDSSLFNSGLWKFIVLDEAHTYSGAQGIEVSMLLRRLKHRLGKHHGDMQCIATSATLTDEDTNQAVEFAENLFNEPFRDDDVIFGDIDEHYVPTSDPYDLDPQTYLRAEFDSLIEVVRNSTKSTEDIALWMAEIGLIPPSIQWERIAQENIENPQKFVWSILKDNGHLIRLRDWMLGRKEEPVSLDTAAKEVFGSEIAIEEEQRIALFHLIELGSIARPTANAAPLLPARYHMFMRSPQGVWICVNPECSGRETTEESGWSKVFSIRRETCDACGCRVFPISVCRECGQVYLKTKSKHSEYVSEAQHQKNDLTPEYETRYFIWKDFQEDRSLGADAAIDEDQSDDTDNDSESNHSLYKAEDLEICLKCGFQTMAGRCKCKNNDNPVHITLKMVQKDHGKGDFEQYKPHDFMNECPRCRSSAQKDTEIATPISIHGTGPLATITYELYRQLPTSTKNEIRMKPGNGRKLLTFYDSRQGAARFASYLQFTVNIENYQHIVPKAVKSFVEKKRVSPNLHFLTKEVRTIAWDLRIFHNDMDVNVTSSPKPNPQQRLELEERISTQILAEITTGRSRRQSLESLGLLAVNYFDPSEPDFFPDIESLSNQLSLSTSKTQTLIEYFLDDLRKRKVVEFPDGVDPSDQSFGAYEGHPTLVRGNAKHLAHQQPWIGKTERHRRYRYMKAVLVANGLPHTDGDVKRALNSIFDWLTDPHNGIMVGSAEDGFRIDSNIFIFEITSNWYQCDKCQRFHAHGMELPCPHPHCDGTLIERDINQAQANNFFYQSCIRDVIPIRVEEHTAQLESEKGRDYQEKFRVGDINVLSCSTTFEMGIDLGDLQAVVMSNVPPTVANYRQRAGRAGRRAGGAAFILTWAADRPHDQTYFRKPSDIIRGQVRVPYIAVDNRFIQSRHINAILLSEFLRYRRASGATDWKLVGSFFDDQYVSDPHLNHLDSWLENRRAQIETLLATFGDFVNEVEVDNWIENFRNDINRVYERYKYLSDYYTQQIQTLQQKLLENIEKNSKSIQDLNKNQKRLREERTIEYFSGNGILPSYSFPLHSVELRLPNGQRNEQLRLQRDLKLAIREYAPGSEIVADKRIWRSDGVQFFRDTVNSREYRICETCNHLEISLGTGVPLSKECRVCGSLPKQNRRKALKFIIPDGFFARSRDNGKPARQYVRTEPSLMRAALIPGQMSDEVRISPIVSYTYDHDGTLLYVNEGDVRYGGFYIHLSGEDRGSLIKKSDRKNAQPVALGHERSTDTLKLHFHSSSYVNVPSSDNVSFWVSLMYALIQGASRALQIERDDIDGVLFPIPISDSGAWEQTVVLYDNVPGGAGHVRQIQKEFASVVREALNIVNCTDCSPETSCYHCLRDYSNQLYHHILKRNDVVRFLEALLNSLSETESSVPGAGNVIAINKPLWIMQQIASAKSNVSIATSRLTLEKPVGALRNWPDLLQELLRRKVNVQLQIINYAVDSSDPESLSIARHLQVLQEKGLKLQEITELPAWQVLIDIDREDNMRAISISDTTALNKTTGTEGALITTSVNDGVKFALEEFTSVSAKDVDAAKLEPPSSVRVINYDPLKMTEKTEQDFFSDLFARPVTELYVNDRYLYDREGIVNRLGSYIQLAYDQGHLEKVTVRTFPADPKYNTGSLDVQNKAIQAIEDKFSNVSIKFIRSHPEHDRYITLTRADLTQARILIGQGLDFIQSNGRNRSTYIVIEDPWK
ncbi:DEAD/DEAH box helicase [Phototrophicus methaneseepsis]|uniref:DEAD/DEAH box helicase n=1 Tax=Phototrophicus methaneseepsis TaxID=2710758 RepID=A0A7S8E5V5_9CHLR|nr:DEAD/DEAH box helicase [Phototrophicus methaneseepsis]QPC80936.1 DEAD/DEAH box helicase [Phototrophicus methaneseepsis]